MYRKYLIRIIAVIFLLTGCAVQKQPEDTETGEYPVFEAGIDSISKYGNIVLSVGAEAMRALGYEPADVVLVTIGSAEMEMPVGVQYTDADSGEPVCAWITDENSGREYVVLAINTGSLAETMGIAVKHSMDAEPGYVWEYCEGFDASVPVTVSMAEKQGYAEEYAMHQTGGVRTNKREDYAYLSDAEYANFREIRTAGMGEGTLFRSSSPIDPSLGRSRQADEAMMNALVGTVINMTDTEERMKAYADYPGSYYSGCRIIALNMNIDFSSAEFEEKLAEGFRFIAANEGPYLLHCKEGKDRTGFAAAIMECLMGAGKDEIIDDYMKTFTDYYNIEEGSEQYTKTAERNILKSLQRAFGIDEIGADTDLAGQAEDYLVRIGMKKDEIAALKKRLQADYGGRY